MENELIVVFCERLSLRIYVKSIEKLISRRISALRVIVLTMVWTKLVSLDSFNLSSICLEPPVKKAYEHKTHSGCKPNYETVVGLIPTAVNLRLFCAGLSFQQCEKLW